MSETEDQRQFWVILFDDTEDVAEFGGTVRISALPSRELAEHFNRRIRSDRPRRVVTLAEAIRVQRDAGTT